MNHRMKIAGACILAVTLLVITGLATADIKGSKHDFSTPEWSNVDECGVCHTPENEFRPATPPLWDSRADLTKRFGKSAISAAGPGMGTRSCLNCHDGTIATDATGAVRGGRFAHTNQLTGFTTGHGRSDHPVGIAYPAFDEDYHPPTMVVAGWKVTLPDGKVECASCHDPHNNSGEKHMLVMNNARSALCLKCHVK